MAFAVLTANGLASSPALAANSTFKPYDFDGDGKADLVVFRPSTGTVFTLKSSSGFTAGISTQYGQAGDIPVPNDYDGDGLVDLSVFRPSQGWWILPSRTSVAAYVGCLCDGNDVPVPGGL